MTRMTKSEIDVKIQMAETMKAESRSNEAKWYWQGVIDGLHLARNGEQ